MTGIVVRPIVDAASRAGAVETLTTAATRMEHAVAAARSGEGGFLARLGTGGTISGGLTDALAGVDGVRRIGSSIALTAESTTRLDGIANAIRAASELRGADRIRATIALVDQPVDAATALREVASELAGPAPVQPIRITPIPTGIDDQMVIDYWNDISMVLMRDAKMTVDVGDLRAAYDRVAVAAGRKYGHDPIQPPIWLRDAPRTGPLELTDGHISSLSIHQQLQDPERLLDRFTAQLRAKDRLVEGFDLTQSMARGFEHIDGARPFDIPPNVLTDDAAAETWSWAMRTQRSRDLLATLDRSKPFATISAILADGNDPTRMSRMRGATKVARELVDELPPASDENMKRAVAELRTTLDELLPNMDRDQYPEYGEYGQAIATANLLATVEHGRPAATNVPAATGAATGTLNW